ncbi:MAG: 30S ribosomal protein S7 [Patescibacteria group bacterium]
MRKPHKKINHLSPDRVYNSKKVSQFINYIMWDGKKGVAESIVYGAFDIIKEREGVDNPMVVFEDAMKNAGPEMEVKSRRVGGANYQVPIPVKVERQVSLAMRWIIDAARSGKGKAMKERLADELILASKNEGTAVNKKINTHKMAEANKAFAHFAW